MLTYKNEKFFKLTNALFLKGYSKINPQMLLKIAHKCYSKLTHKRYSKIDPQMLLKN